MVCINYIVLQTLAVDLMKVRRMFLLDSVGALVSAVILGLVLPYWSVELGVPQAVLYVFASVAVVFAIYSMLCFVFAKGAVFLRAIAIANILYCVLTAMYILFAYENVTWLGYVYFLSEIVVIASIANWELKVANQQ